MFKLKKNIIAFILMFIGAVGLIYLIIYQFMHIDMTKTRIFVNNWYIIIITFACILIGRLLFKAK